MMRTPKRADNGGNTITEMSEAHPRSQLSRQGEQDEEDSEESRQQRQDQHAWNYAQAGRPLSRVVWYGLSFTAFSLSAAQSPLRH